MNDDNEKMPNGVKIPSLLQRFIDASGLLLCGYRVEDMGDLYLELRKDNKVLYSGHGFSWPDAFNSILDDIMLCKQFKSNEEMEIWIDIHEGCKDNCCTIC